MNQFHLYRKWQLATLTLTLVFLVTNIVNGVIVSPHSVSHPIVLRDIGAALESIDAPLYVEEFDEHISKMEGFHRRWMPSNSAKQAWINRVRNLDIHYMAPQHGRIFTGDNVTRFLDWFERLEVGKIG